MVVNFRKIQVIIASLLVLSSLIGCSCLSFQKKENIEESTDSKIKVLNLGTFHFGYTPDANKTSFDEHSESAKREVRALAKIIAEFKPSIICVETLPEKDSVLNAAYQAFLRNPKDLNLQFGESSMLGFEVGRLAGVEKIYGIDNHMGYNYSVGDFIERSPDYTNSIDPKTYLQLTQEPFKDYPELAKREEGYDQLSLLGKLQLINEPLHLDYSINTNADKLLYVGIGDGFEGPDNAARFYHRNMKIFANLNRIPMQPDDRVFILMGTAHTAFLREFFRRSPKFKMCNTLDYLEP